ncbi:hypothetical protein [Paludisphaera mucosa]|uniref:Lipoprotein n=1 Tax=Paludisphaera mucosa TaxID=3030827 RepID=A0ABT6FJA3_9BACT|nr:hypothetical protein [Paludisphaera mucosa]MDG3007637.1 hypothetical protein [Paludisphaera mucosa]
MTKLSRMTLPTLALAAALAAGCGGDPNPPNSPQLYQNNVLAEVGDMYNTHFVQHKKPPQGLKDLSPFADTLPTGLGAARRGEVVVLWGVDPVDPAGSDAAGEEILAYLKEAPESGGGVLTRNLKVKSMTADEFKAAPKAAGKVEEPAKAGKSGKAG